MTGGLRGKSQRSRTVVFVDRDGTINRNYEDGPVYQVDRFVLLPRAAEGIRLLNDSGVRVFVVTNQGGIRHKDRDFTWEEYRRIEQLMHEGLKKSAGAFVDDIFICHHADYENCDCRKPEIGLLERAREKYAFEVSSSYIIGDSSADIIAGKRFGLITILVESGWQENVLEKLQAAGCVPDKVASDLLEAARHISSELSKDDAGVVT